MKKVLFVATVVRKHINVFHLPYLKMFQNEGYTTYVVAANDTDIESVSIPYCDYYVEIDFKRNPLHPKNLTAYKKLKKLIEENNFDIIHCHTPVGGFLGRLAAKKTRKKGTKVMYTAHGFHFYKGAPLKNWMIYYPAEKLCAHYTDKLITINQEDYALAQQKMKAKEVFHVPGVGVDLTKFQNVSVDKLAKRRELGIPNEATVLLSVGELNENKNHQVIICAMAQLHRDDLYYMIAGVGPKADELKQLAESLGLADRVHLLGYRKDIPELCHTADIFCFPSYREGLSVSLMEAMGSGLPCVVSKIRGNTDLIDSNGGAFFDPHSVNECCGALERVLVGDHAAMAGYNRQKIQHFSVQNVLEIMKSIYSKG